ncbi:hypothetical protein AB0L67_41470 [Streptomyces flaveolus]
MTDVDTGSRDRLALAVLAQYRMATTEQMNLMGADRADAAPPGDTSR